MKNIFCFAAALLSSFSVIANGQDQDTQKAPPNVLLILVDDLKPALKCYGDPIAVSPNIDRLAERGMRFEKAYCNQAVCISSRYNLMLGSRSTSTGFYRFGHKFREHMPDAITLPQHFINHGYTAHSLGKVYHIGHGNQNDRASWSVPHHADKVIEYADPKNNRVLTRAARLFGQRDGMAEDGKAILGAPFESPDVMDSAYADYRVAKAAVDRLHWLKDCQDKPFFLAVGFVRPHLPFSAPKRYWDLYDPDTLPMPEYEKAPEGSPRFAVKDALELTGYNGIPRKPPFDPDLTRQLIHGYYASVSYMDVQVGRLLEGLRQADLDDNTIVVLWGDHGWHLGDHGSWTKHSNYEQANRIPIIISAPGVTQPGSVTHQLTETVDLYPTLASLAGLPAPKGPQPIDGINLTPVLQDGKKRVREYAYHAYPRSGYLGRAIRTVRYRMVEWTRQRKDDEPESDTSPIYELYDYQEDPLETINLAKTDTQTLADMKALLDREPPARPSIPKIRK